MPSEKSDSLQLGTATIENPLSPERLQDAFNGYQLTQAVYVAAKLGLPDYLKTGAKTCEELAVASCADETVLMQFMELLATLGLVAKDEKDYYQLTDISSLLVSDNPNSVLGLVLHTDLAYPAWGDLLYSVQTGKAAFDHTFQTSLYEHLTQNDGANKRFNRWMEESTRDWLIPALESYDFSKFTHFLDIGGSTGRLTTEILTKYPTLQATIFDQAHVVSGAQNALESAGVSHRCQILAGDFFESIPTRGDLYIVSRVLLNWDDVHALKILKNCRAAMDESDKLLIMDFVLPNRGVTAAEILSSLHLQVLGGRLMRREDEYDNLLAKAGFQSPKLIQTGGAIRFIEAIPMPSTRKRHIL